MLESNPSVAFRRFIREHPRIEETGIAIEVFFLRWQASRLTERELQQSPASLNRGLAVVSAGRLIDAQDARQQTRNRMPKNREFSRSVYGVRQRALGALGRAEDYSGLVRWEVSRFCGSGNRPHLISSCLCDTRRSDLIRSNAIVAATIAVRDQTGTFDLVIPEPSSSVSASDNKPGFSRVFGICSPATLRCRRGEKGISQADKRGDFEEPFSGPQIATRAARQSGARPSTTNGKTSASVPHSLVPSSGRIFEALLTSMLREGRRLTEIAADRQRGSHWGNQR